jgi:hypothetical protein
MNPELLYVFETLSFKKVSAMPWTKHQGAS